ncbi:DBP10CT-domain-containing protein [Xylariaceae sp. AK1471]|nr:DBP10CT-domain-containing protein [Xylariaceae sp. AK1471]
MRGWAYSLVKETDVPYLLDLQLFLGQKLVLGKDGKGRGNFAGDMVVGAPMRSNIENYTEWLNKLLSEDSDLRAMQTVSEKAEKLYLKTRNSASSQSARRAREVVTSKGFSQVHPIYGDEISAAEDDRADMMAKISGFKPQETIFEIRRAAKGGKTTKEAEVMKQIRERFGPRRTAGNKEDESKGLVDEDDRAAAREVEDADGFDVEDEASEDEPDDIMMEDEDEVEVEVDSDSEMEVTISNHKDTTNDKKSRKSSSTDDPNAFRDPEFMAYEPRTVNAAEERAYGVHTGGQSNASGNFFEAARSATFDLTNDEGAKSFGVPTRAGMRWDKKNAKYVSRTNDEDGSRAQGKNGGTKMVRGESGVKIAASFQSGRFDRWKKEQRVGRLPRIGETERRGPGSVAAASGRNTILGGGTRYKHKQEKAPKAADKYRDDYHERKKRVEEAKEKRVGRFRDGAGNKKELKNADDIRKERKIKEQKRLKNARPARK